MGGRVRMYTPAATARYEDRVAYRASLAIEAAGLDTPCVGPVRLSIVARLRRPQKPARAHEARAGTLGPHGRRYATKRPDIDNIAKSIADGLQLCNVFADDRSIAELSVLKVWAADDEAPGCGVTVSPVRGCDG